MPKIKTGILCIGLLLLAIGIAYVLVQSAPTPERTAVEKPSQPVEDRLISLTNRSIQLRVNGVVRPAEKITLAARVSGEILSMSDAFIEGGTIEAGTPLLQIEQTDYQLALADAQALLAQRRFEYELELGRQAIAQREWALLGAKEATEAEEKLALRAPHLAASEAALAAAQAGVERAQLQLERTTLTAPFNALILSREASLGTQVTPAQPLAQLAGTDRYYVEAAIPHDRLNWLHIPGAKARIEATTGARYEGEVIQFLGSLETQGRMVKLLIAVDDPLGKLHPKEKPLLLNEYVSVQLSGIVLEQVSILPRKALRSDQTVWVNEDNQLRIYPVEILFREQHELLVRGLPDNTLVILSELSTPIPNMPVISEEPIR